MKKKILNVLVAITVVAGVLLGLTRTAHAGLQDFTINSFDADYTLTNADPQGTLTIVEKIDVTFTDNNHGLLRAIPDTYKGHKLQIDVTSVVSETAAPAQFSTSTSNGNTVIKIGNPNSTVTGHQSYSIKYKVNNVITFYSDHNELYWDINGDQWSQPTTKVSLNLHLPPGLLLLGNCGDNSSCDTAPKVPPVNCFTGAFGSKESRCQISTSGSDVLVSTQAGLAARQTLTVVAAFAKGNFWKISGLGNTDAVPNGEYFTPHKWYDTMGEYTAQLAGFFIMPVVFGSWALMRWQKKGRDPKGSGVIVAQYDAPKGLAPIHVGSLSDFKVDNRDVTATIIDLAVKKYIKIIETKKDHFIVKDSLDYSFELLKVDTTGLDDEEASLLLKMYPNFVVGSVVDSKILVANNFYQDVSSVKKTVTSRLVKEGYYRGNPMTSGASMWVVVGILAVLMFFAGGLFGVAFVMGTIVAILIVGGFALLMPARTEKGVEAKEHIEGLKLYLSVAEKDRIKMLQSPGSPFSSAANAPQRTVELFEKLLPYAIALGVEKQWAKEFNDIYKQPPEWFSGNWSTFNAYYLASSITGSMQSAMATSFAPPSSSGSSGFGGGGFSGGGGGGGGGGGW